MTARRYDKTLYQCDAMWNGIRCRRAARIEQWDDRLERRLCLECFARLAVSQLGPRFSFIGEAPE